MTDTLPEVPTPAALRDALAAMLAGAARGSVKTWHSAIGEVEILSLAFHPRSNWRVTPKGTPQQCEAIDRAVEIVRAAHPYVHQPSEKGPTLRPSPRKS